LAANERAVDELDDKILLGSGLGETVQNTLLTTCFHKLDLRERTDGTTLAEAIGQRRYSITIFFDESN